MPGAERPAWLARNGDPLQAVEFRLSHGRLVHYTPESGWSPRWRDDTHNLDMAVHQQPVQQVDSLPRPWTSGSWRRRCPTSASRRSL